jgi:hypothetical protein
MVPFDRNIIGIQDSESLAGGETANPVLRKAKPLAQKHASRVISSYCPCPVPKILARLAMHKPSTGFNCGTHRKGRTKKGV